MFPLSIGAKALPLLTSQGIKTQKKMISFPLPLRTAEREAKSRGCGPEVVCADYYSTTVEYYNQADLEKKQEKRMAACKSKPYLRCSNLVLL